MYKITKIIFFTQESWDLHKVGGYSHHYGNVVKITDKRLRPDLGCGNDYYEIEFFYTR